MIGLLKWNTSYRLVSSTFTRCVVSIHRRLQFCHLCSSSHCLCSSTVTTFFIFFLSPLQDPGNTLQMMDHLHNDITYMSTSDNFYEEKGDSKSPGSLLDWRVWCVYPIHRFYKSERHERSRDIGNDWFYYWHWLLGPVNWMFRTRGIPSRAQVFLYQTKINSDALWRTKWSDILDVNYTN